MYIDRDRLVPYRFDGEFFTFAIDESKPLDQQKEEKVSVLVTKCDIQESGKALSGTITASYAVYFPFDEAEGVKITAGMEFEGDVYGFRVNGEVKFIAPTQMGGCIAYIVDKTV